MLRKAETKQFKNQMTNCLIHQRTSLKESIKNKEKGNSVRREKGAKGTIRYEKMEDN